MMATVATETIVQEITVKASAQRVFEALTDPRQRLAWWSRKGRFVATHFDSDLRVGGKWMMRGTGMGKPFTVRGEYRAIEPPRVLAFTWQPGWRQGAEESLVRFDLAEKDGVTTVRLTHSGLTRETAQVHKGWPQLLDSLRAHAEGSPD